MDNLLNFKVEGMTCGGCVRSVRAALEAVPGVTIEQLVPGGEAQVRLDPAQATPDIIAAAVEEAGYRPVFQQTL